MAFSATRTGNISLLVSDDREPVFEIRDLQLQNVRLQKGGRFLIGRDVPLPLYWEQYVNHEHPERNCGSHGAIQVLEENADRVMVKCTGATHSGSVLSEYVLVLNRGAGSSGYMIDVQAALRIAQGALWEVTHNSHHGELEFCNFWPEGVFTAEASQSLLYNACYVVRSDAILAIPHTHTESPDKHNIKLQPGDRMVWLLEDENPCIEFLSGGNVTAGICAYMWDAHLAYRVCGNGKDETLQAGTEYAASFRISVLNREEGSRLVAHAENAKGSDTPEVPVILDGEHTFSETFGNTKAKLEDVWPWETEVVSGDARRIRFLLDHEVGLDDRNSLRIDSSGLACVRWKATAIGPAFRQQPFKNGQRYRLVGYVRFRLSAGDISISILLHREGNESLFDSGKYELFQKRVQAPPSSEWIRVEAETPHITPAPDRLHIQLEMNGTGSCWFDNVHLMREE